MNVVLPLAETNEYPSEPPLKLPGLPNNMSRLGTRAQDCINLETSLGSEEREFRLEAFRKREKLEEQGYGDELAEMQQTLWPVDSLREGSFKIDMLFEYRDADGPVLQWCQGEVIEFLSEKDNTHVIVRIEWNEKCLKKGDPTITKQKLMRTKWNPDKPGNGAWREDLYHKILKMN